MRRQSISYWHSDPGRASAFRGRGAKSPVTSTKPFPAKFEASFFYDDQPDETLHCTLYLDRFEDHRVGVAQMDLVVSGKSPRSLTSAAVRRFPLTEMLVEAVLMWSWNSDDSPVTRGQAMGLTRRGATAAEGREERLRRAARAHIDAERPYKGQAVMKALGMNFDSKAHARARKIIEAAKKDGIYDDVKKEMGL
jgi:hypothetical protein